MKTKEELNALKEEAKKEAKPEEKGGVMLTDEELAQVSGGRYIQDLVDNYQYAYTGIEYSGSDSSQTESH